MGSPIAIASSNAPAAPSYSDGKDEHDLRPPGDPEHHPDVRAAELARSECCAIDVFHDRSCAGPAIRQGAEALEAGAESLPAIASSRIPLPLLVVLTADRDDHFVGARQAKLLPGARAALGRSARQTARPARAR